MNILYLEHYAGSPEMGMEFRPYYLSREWVNMGNKVTIIAGDYSHLRKKNPSVEKDWHSENIDGIEYVWLKTGEYEGNGLARARTMERFVRKLWFNASMIAKKWKPNVVIASSTYPLDTYPAQRIAKIANAKYIHEVHDMWPATLYEVGGMSKKHPFVVAMQIAENSAYKHCDKCVSLPPYAKEYMVAHGLDPDKFIHIQNGVVEEEWREYIKIPDEHKSFFKKHENDFIVGYFGGHAMSNALDQCLDVAKRIQDFGEYKDVIFVFVGEGVEKKRLIHRSVEEKIENVFFLPGVNKRAIPDLLSNYDCSYMTGISSPLYRFGLSLNKMLDSMMAGIPIICAFDAPETLVKEYRCGFQCNPNDVDEVMRCIVKIKEMPNEKRQEMGQKGREAILCKYTYSKLAHVFMEAILGE